MKSQSARLIGFEAIEPKDFTTAMFLSTPLKPPHPDFDTKTQKIVDFTLHRV